MLESRIFTFIEEVSSWWRKPDCPEKTVDLSKSKLTNLFTLGSDLVGV